MTDDIKDEQDAERVFDKAVSENRAAGSAYADEATARPGAREAARVEKTLAPESREAFRNSLAENDDLKGGY